MSQNVVNFGRNNLMGDNLYHFLNDYESEEDASAMLRSQITSKHLE